MNLMISQSLEFNFFFLYLYMWLIPLITAETLSCRQLCFSITLSLGSMMVKKLFSPKGLSN